MGEDLRKARLPAKIVAIRQETPTIRSFRLDLGGREIGFMAGQWVDFFVTLEGAEAVGGYSITSSPAEQTAISLAVKRDGSDHPVTNWLHEEAQVGDEVEIALGGDFFYEPDEADSVVLIAGGIGLTPLMSIVRSAHELATRTRLILVYSASTPDELLFRDELDSIAAVNPRDQVRLHDHPDRARHMGRTQRPHRRRSAPSRVHRPRRPLLRVRPPTHDPRDGGDAQGPGGAQTADQIRAVVVDPLTSSSSSGRRPRLRMSL